MKKYVTYTLGVVLAIAFAVVIAETAVAAGSVDPISPPQSGDYETIDGVLAIKEGHGEFLIRMPDGKAQRFSVRVGSDAVEITRNGKPARFSDLRVSDSIQVKYGTSNRSVIAIYAREMPGKTQQSQSGQYESVKGVLSIKEGHGDFLVRLADGSAQRFRVRGNAAEITRNGEPARYSELKPSDSIQVNYDPSNRDVIAIHAQGS